MVGIHWEQRILHQLREVEIDLRKSQQHTNSPELEQITQDVALLRTIIETAFERTIEEKGLV